MNLSVIVSVYNLEKYIAKCIESFYNQNIPFDDYELIIIDDGSTDKSSEIIISYSKKYSNIRYYYKNNGGASSARNYGLPFARGKYIWFFDGDDWVKPNILKSILEIINSFNPDTIYLNYTRINESNYVLHETSFGRINILSGIDLFKIASGDFIMPHRHIIKKEIILNNNITFIEGITFEDDEWAPRLLYYSNKCFIYKEPIYYYLKRKSSLMASFNHKKIPSFLKVIESLKFFRDNNVKNNIFKKRLNIYIIIYISNYLRYRNYRKIKGDDDIKKIKEINALSTYGLDLKKLIQYLFIKYIPYLYSKIFAAK